MDYKVKIEPWERDYCMAVAKQREINTQEMGLEENVINGEQLDVYFAGFIGELSFAKAMGIYAHINPDLDVADCIYRGQSLDIKCVREEHHRLLVNADKANKPPEEQVDYYALVVYLEPYAQVIGYVSPAEIFRVDDSGKRVHWDATLPEPGYAMRQGLLVPFPY